jgi:hypothetical protein
MLAAKTGARSGPLSREVADLEMKLGNTLPDTAEYKMIKKQLATKKAMLKASHDSYKRLMQFKKDNKGR